MRNSRFTEAQIIGLIKEQEAGMPTLEQCALGTARASVVRLHAACVAEFRATRDLSHIDRRILAAVRTDIGGYNGVSEDEREQFEEAVDALLFRDNADADAFITGYVEAQLASGSETADVSLLERKPTFHFLLPARPLEWLRKFPAIAHHALNRLCPSSDDLGHEGLIGNGGSGSLMVQSMPLSADETSDASRSSLP